jgi:hypothetical protein
MAHARGDMAVVYPERIGDGRLRTVIDYLRTWLFGQLETTQDQHDREGPRQRAKRWGGRCISPSTNRSVHHSPPDELSICDRYAVTGFPYVRLCTVWAG